MYCFPVASFASPSSFCRQCTSFRATSGWEVSVVEIERQDRVETEWGYMYSNICSAIRVLREGCLNFGYVELPLLPAYRPVTRSVGCRPAGPWYMIANTSDSPIDIDSDLVDVIDPGWELGLAPDSNNIAQLQIPNEAAITCSPTTTLKLELLCRIRFWIDVVCPRPLHHMCLDFATACLVALNQSFVGG